MQHQHQFVVMGEGKSEGNMTHKDVMCAECGMKKRLHEDGTMEMTKEGTSKDVDKKEDTKG